MTYTLRDAWADEKAFGDWPFEKWLLPPLKLRESFDYFARGDFAVPSARIHDRLMIITGHMVDPEFLQEALQKVEEIVDCAIDQSEAEANQAWTNHSLWMPLISEAIVASEEPASLAIESIDMVGAPDGFEDAELCAVMGFWCLGEYSYHCQKGDIETALRMFSQSALALTEANWYAGLASMLAQQKGIVSGRNRKAAMVGHQWNRERKTMGRSIWQSKNWAVQADAERAIVLQCCITQQVAGRWIREFKRAEQN